MSRLKYFGQPDGQSEPAAWPVWEVSAWIIDVTPQVNLNLNPTLDIQKTGIALKGHPPGDEASLASDLVM